jgi:large subunit ribosomal protein L28
MSETLGTFISFEATPNTIRSVEHNNGIDNYLLTTCSSKLSKKARTLKKKILKKITAKQPS